MRFKNGEIKCIFNYTGWYYLQKNLKNKVSTGDSPYNESSYNEFSL
jgi:hypothetical protein